MKKKHWNWFERKNGNLITNGKRYSLLETDSNGTLISVALAREEFLDECMETDFKTGGYLEPTESYISWWQRIIAFIRELPNMIWGKI